MSVEWNSEEVLQRVRIAVMQGIVRGAESVRNEAIDLILSTEKTGRVYRRRSVLHQASAPGEPPASDTGRLVGSIRTEYNVAELLGLVKASTAYAAALEFGTQRMVERPYMRPALAKKRAEIEADVAEAVRAAVAL